VLKYRVPGRPWMDFGAAPMQDAERAMGVIRNRAQEFNIDPHRLGFSGFSAGANLCAHISTGFANRTYARIDGADDQNRRPDVSLLIYPWRVVETDLETLTFNVTAQHPPAFLAQAEDDPTAPIENSLYYFLQLKAIGAPPSELHAYPRGGHGFGLCTVDTPWHAECTWPDRAALFLKDLWSETFE